MILLIPQELGSDAYWRESVEKGPLRSSLALGPSTEVGKSVFTHLASRPPLPLLSPCDRAGTAKLAYRNQDWAERTEIDLMEPVFGWTLLSADAIRRVEARLREDAQGVRDEIGFMYLHQAYADRFFPGTSVQHTRLRYALFVPWIYQRIAGMDLRRRRENSIEKMILDEEIRLTGRLLDAGESEGVIGRRVYPQRRASSQPATMVYWSALAAWGLLRRLEDGSAPARAAVHRMLSSDWRQSRLHDDDGIPVEEAHAIFATLPAPPAEWSNQSQPITFKLEEVERTFIRRQLLTTRRASVDPSLLARLAEKPGIVGGSKAPWSKGVSGLADSQDRAALERARRSAALAAIGRAVYAALVEELRDQRDKISTSMRHRTHLPETIARYRDHALELDIPCTCVCAHALVSSKTRKSARLL